MKKKSLNLICGAMAAAMLLSATGCVGKGATLTPEGATPEPGKLVEITEAADPGKNAGSETDLNAVTEEETSAETIAQPMVEPVIEPKPSDPDVPFIEPVIEPKPTDPADPFVEPVIEPKPENPDDPTLKTPWERSVDPVEYIDPDDYDANPGNIDPVIGANPVEPDVPYIEPQIEPYPGYRGDGGPIAMSGEVGDLKFHLTTAGASGSALERGYYILETGDKDYPYMLVVNTGEHSTGGYSSYITDLFYSCDTFMITIATSEPSPESAVIQALTYPYCGILLNKLPETIDVIDAACMSGEFARIDPGEIPVDVMLVDACYNEIDD